MTYHLVAVYYKDYRCLKDVVIPFDARYKVSFDKEEDSLTVEYENTMPDDFWGDSIESVSCIVGDNGAGKTTSLRYIMNNIVEGRPELEEDVNVMIFATSDHKLIVYSKSEVKVCTVLEHKVVHEKTSMPVIVYSSHFNPAPKEDDTLGYELNGSRIISDGWLLYHDIEDSTGVGQLNGALPYLQYANAHILQDRYRIVRFIHDNKEICNRFNFEVPSLLKLHVSNQSSLFFRENKIDYPPLKQKPLEDAKSIFDFRFFYVVFMNHAKDYNQIRDRWFEVINTMMDRIEGTNVIEQVKELADNLPSNIFSTSNSNEATLFFQLTEMIPELIKKAVSVLEYVNKVCTFNTILNCYTIKIDDSKVKSLFDCMYKDNQMVTGQYLEVEYAHNIASNSNLSSGELMMLNLMSRLYHVLVTRPMYNGSEKNSTTLVLLDEGEGGFHPEWQRLYIQNLLIFFNGLPKHHKYQLVVTTHSPIILSDIPNSAVTFLKRENHRTVVRDNMERETFGANIYDLLQDSFFVSSAVGEFVQSKISRIFEIYNEADETKREALFEAEYKNIAFVINNIADKYIAAEAKRMFEELSVKSHHKTAVLERLKREIAERQAFIDKYKD